jgi:hypothetical protein
MVTLRVVLAVREPEVPVTVALYWPGTAVLLAVSVRVLDPEVGSVRKRQSRRWAGCSRRDSRCR